MNSNIKKSRKKFKIVIGGTICKDMIDLAPFDIHWEKYNKTDGCFWFTICFICFYWEWWKGGRNK